MQYPVGEIVYVNLIGEIVRIEKDRFTGEVTYKVNTKDLSETIVVSKKHISAMPNPKDFEKRLEGCENDK